MGSGPPPTSGNPRSRRQGPRKRSWNWPSWRARNRPPPGRQRRCQQVPRRHQRAQRRYPPALMEEEAGILQFEVSSAYPRAPSIF
jgi:hypothetical protein